MIKQNTYNYLSLIIFCSAIFYLILFLLFCFNYNFKYNVNLTQLFLTLFFSLLILSFLAYHSLRNNEFNNLLFYIIYIASIPLIFHSLYFIFFSKYSYKNMDYIKIELVIFIMIYLTIIWFNIKKLINKNIIYTNILNLIKDMFQILFMIL